MINRTKLTLVAALAAAAPLCAQAHGGSATSIAAGAHLFAHASVQGVASDRAQDGLAGPVRRVRTETAKITTKGGKPVEGPRVLLETATYDIKGVKVDNAYFLAAAGGTLTGKEVYKYDDKGNIMEMTQRNDDGTLLSKETYAYEFDMLGNWTKMVTSVAVVEGGTMTSEPTEVTYRTISYFLDEATLAKMSQPAASTAASAPAAVTTGGDAPAVASSPPAAQPAASESKANVNNAGPAMSAAAPTAGEKVESRPVKMEASKMASAPAVASADKVNVSATMNFAAVGANSPNAGPVVVSEGEAPAKPVARGSLKPISGGILNGKAMALPAPSYPDVARRMRTAGVVMVEVIIDLNGRVISAKAVDGPAMLQAAAEQAARNARFSPTLLSGEPVRVSGQIKYNFTLN